MNSVFFLPCERTKFLLQGGAFVTQTTQNTEIPVQPRSSYIGGKHRGWGGVGGFSVSGVSVGKPPLKENMVFPASQLCLHADKTKELRLL